MPEPDKRVIALEVITTDLERLIRQADAHGLSLVAYMLEMAAAEARDELSTNSTTQKKNVTKLRPR